MAPPMVASARSGRAGGSDDEILEETLDMRFHVEKQEDPNVGKIIADRYCIKSLVGRGGMGMVYKAEQMNIERLVAIKMLHPHIIADADTIKRFHKEAQAISKVEHANSVRIYDFGITDNAQPYLVMDFIDGQSVRHVLREEGTLSLPRAGNIFAQVVEALHFAHSVGVVHRDMKPENIMLCQREGNPDCVYVVDFGISSLAENEQATGESSQGERRGSPAYMSPEQCTKGAEVGPASDVYSLALVVYECVSGRLPYNARNTIEYLEAHINAAPLPLTAANPALSACEALAYVLAKAMEKQPDKRQANIEEFGADLAEAVKRDQIRLNYLKNRKETVFSSSSSQLPAIAPKPAVESVPRPGNLTPMQGLPILQSGAHKIIETVIGAALGKPEEQADDQEPGRFVFVNCPHCNEPVEPHIAFCLACGRSLATTQDFSKVRAATGVFALPRSQDTLSTAVPVFSPKTRLGSGGLTNLQKGLWLACLLLLAAIIWVAGGADLVSKALNPPPQHKPLTDGAASEGANSQQP